jgi:hypothetical protein
MDDVVIVRNVARHPVWIGKELVEPGGVWSGERGFVMIALWRYPGRLVFVEEPHPSPPQIGEGVVEGSSGDNSLLSSEGEERQKAKGEGKSIVSAPVKRVRRRKKAVSGE